VADELRKDAGLDVHLEDGAQGEFTVSIGGRTVAQKTDSLPPVEQVVEAVRVAA